MLKYPENVVSGKVFLIAAMANVDVHFFAPCPISGYPSSKTKTQLYGVPKICKQIKQTSFQLSCKKYLTEGKFSATNCPRHFD